jgi:maltose O-acetyltransferase
MLGSGRTPDGDPTVVAELRRGSIREAEQVERVRFSRMGRLDRAARMIYSRWFRSSSLESLKRRGLIVGRNFNLMVGATIDPSHCWHIRIGDNVTIARDALVLAHDASTKTHLGFTRIGKVEIGDRVFIGAKAIILPGVRIGSDVVIGAGSVVSRDIPDGMVAWGVPARCMLSTAEWIERRNSELELVPLFGREYTESNGVTSAMRDEMNAKMKDGHGYVA